jgi:hypothetical protein
MTHRDSIGITHRDKTCPDAVASGRDKPFIGLSLPIRPDAENTAAKVASGYVAPSPPSSASKKASSGWTSLRLYHVRARSPTLASPRVVAPTFPSRRSTQRVATRLPTCDLPLWHPIVTTACANRYLAKFEEKDWPVGTGPRLSRVCFVCPVFRNAAASKD